jgi:hypothetical protein
MEDEMIDRFHVHLDVCKQCRDHPFELCPTGAELLKGAAMSATQDRIGKKFKVNCGSKYFELKYGGSPVIEIEEEFHVRPWPPASPPVFLYQGRVIAEGRKDLLSGTIYYGHINGLGEFVHESELGEEVKSDGTDKY